LYQGVLKNILEQSVLKFNLGVFKIVEEYTKNDEETLIKID
jgi:hypothetical protein